MHVFVTGAAGYIGRAVTQELINHGHTVLGLCRNDANAEIVTKLGGTPHRGDLSDLESLRSGAKEADGVIHLAFVHDFSNLAASVAADQAGITAMGDALAGTGKPLIIASGTLLAANGGLATEDTEPVRNGSTLSKRAESADIVYNLAKEKQVRGMVVRIPPNVHGDGDRGTVPSLVGLARKNKAAVYVGDGMQRWPSVNLQDCALLFRLALEKGRAGATYNVVAEEAVAMKAINDLIAKKLDVPAVSKTMEEAQQALGFLAFMISSDNPTSSEKTRMELDWKPIGPGLLEDMSTFYFADGISTKFM